MGKRLVRRRRRRCVDVTSVGPDHRSLGSHEDGLRRAAVRAAAAAAGTAAFVACVEEARVNIVWAAKPFLNELLHFRCPKTKSRFTRTFDDNIVDGVGRAEQRVTMFYNIIRIIRRNLLMTSLTYDLM